MPMFMRHHQSGRTSFNDLILLGVFASVAEGSSPFSRSMKKAGGDMLPGSLVAPIWKNLKDVLKHSDSSNH